MNILFISRLYPSTPSGSGEDVTVALHKLAACWNKNHRVVVVRPVYIYLSALLRRKTGRLRKKIVVRDNVTIIVFPVFKIPRTAYYYAPLYRFLKRYLKREGYIPQVVVAHYDKCLQIGLHYARQNRLPLVAGIHAAPDLLGDDAAAFKLRCGDVLEAASLIACRSQFIYRQISTWFPRYREKCFIAFSGIDESIIQDTRLCDYKLKQWHPVSRPTLNPHKEGEEGADTLQPVSILTVCVLIPRKKVDTTLQALALLSPDINWLYTIIGDGEERAHLTQLARELGIAHRVVFKGVLPHQQVLEHMAGADIFIMASIMESFGLVYLEAMACNDIVIAGKGEGVDGIILHKKNGFLVPPGEPRQLKNLLEEIILHTSSEALKELLHQSHHTLCRYTDQKAADNYLKKIIHIQSHNSHNSRNSPRYC